MRVWTMMISYAARQSGSNSAPPLSQWAKILSATGTGGAAQNRPRGVFSAIIDKHRNRLDAVQLFFDRGDLGLNIGNQRIAPYAVW